MSKKKSFRLPKAFLTQLKEFTNGFVIIAIDQNQNFNHYNHFPNDVAEMAIVNHMDVLSEQLQEHIRSSGALTSDDEEEDNDEFA